MEWDRRIQEKRLLLTLTEGRTLLQGAWASPLLCGIPGLHSGCCVPELVTSLASFHFPRYLFVDSFPVLSERWLFAFSVPVVQF